MIFLRTNGVREKENIFFFNFCVCMPINLL